MARFPNTEIERLRREVSLERLVAARGVKLSRHGADLRGRCPFHEDNAAKLVVNLTTNTWSCPECGGGTGIEWTMKSAGVSFRHAVELLRSDHPAIAITSEKRGRQTGPVPRKSTVVRVGKLVEPDADDDALMRSVVGYYHNTLAKSPEALAYLGSRGLRNAEMIEHFKLGLADRTLGYRLPQKSRKEGSEVRDRLERLGIFRSSGHEHMAGSLVVPVFEGEGSRIVGMYGRKITRRLRAGTALHVYTPDPMRGVFNEPGLAHGDVVLTSGLFDALTWWCSGVKNVTATFGSDGLRADLRDALHRHRVQRVYLAFRRDRAADEAAERMSVELNAMGIDAHRVLFPAGVDANDYARAEPSADALTEALRKAEWMGKGKPLVVASEHAPAGPTEPKPDTRPIPKKPKEPSMNAHVSVTAPPPPSPTTKPGEMLFHFGDRTWRARGIGQKATHEAMKVNLFVSREGFGFHVDTIDLYSARQRIHYVSMAAVELGVEERIVKREIGEILLKLEQEHDETLTATTRPDNAERPKLTADEEKAAFDLLRDPRLLDRVLADLECCGVIGEADNKLVGYLAAVSRKLDRPLAVLIQSSSASGKSSLMEAILDFVPEEDRLSFSALTGQSLFYLGDADLRHKVLSIAEEEGAARASYALKVLQSEGRLTIASTGKEPTTGRLVSQRYTVEGPVALFTTTTALDVDEELVSRCIVLAVDERPEHTKAIHVRQRRAQTLDALFDREDHAAIVQLHRNAQRLLAPVAVVNPFAHELGFADHRVRARRDHQKYLGLIEALAFLHQHQRPTKTAERGGRSIQYVEVTKEDIAVADRLAAAVLSNGLADLPPTTRHVLGLLDAMVTDMAKARGLDRADARFSRREVRERLGIGGTQLWVHLRRLVDAEHVIVHPSRHGRGVVYELAHEGTTTSVRGRSGQIRPSFGPYSGDVRGGAEETMPRQERQSRDPEPSEAGNSHFGTADGASSYTRDASG
jgi:hypothetical protein